MLNSSTPESQTLLPATSLRECGLFVLWLHLHRDSPVELLQLEATGAHCDAHRFQQTRGPTLSRQARGVQRPGRAQGWGAQL